MSRSVAILIALAAGALAACAVEPAAAIPETTLAARNSAQQTCRALMFQYDSLVTDRSKLPSNHPSFALRDGGEAKCRSGDTRGGHDTLHQALRAVGYRPIP